MITPLLDLVERTLLVRVPNKAVEILVPAVAGQTAVEVAGPREVKVANRVAAAATPPNPQRKYPWPHLARSPPW